MFEYPTMDVRSADLVDEPIGLTTEEVKDILKEKLRDYFAADLLFLAHHAHHSAMPHLSHLGARAVHT